jgi:hypothetical protein
VGKVGTLGDACSSPGATACNGNDSQVVLICQGGSWALSTTCPSTQRCDSTVGACADVAAGCQGLHPGDDFCSGGSVVQCGVDLTSTTTVTTCGTHQTCTPSGVTASCVCNPAPACTVAGSTCGPDASLATCQVDGQGCMYLVSDQACGGACSGDAGHASCCTNDPGCSGASYTCNGAGNGIVSCALGSDGCYHQSTSSCIAGFTCQYAQDGAYCGCPNSAACAGEQSGTRCVAGQYGDMVCGCQTSADCLGGACCYTQQASWLCYTGTIGGKTCVNGVWQ